MLQSKLMSAMRQGQVSATLLWLRQARTDSTGGIAAVLTRSEQVLNTNYLPLQELRKQQPVAADAAHLIGGDCGGR